MNSYNPFICNFSYEEKRAKAMSVEALLHNIADCQACIKNGIDYFGKYVDQISVYRKELLARKGVKG